MVRIHDVNIPLFLLHLFLALFTNESKQENGTIN